MSDLKCTCGTEEWDKDSLEFVDVEYKTVEESGVTGGQMVVTVSFSCENGCTFEEEVTLHYSFCSCFFDRDDREEIKDSKDHFKISDKKIEYAEERIGESLSWHKFRPGLAWIIETDCNNCRKLRYKSISFKSLIEHRINQ